MSIIPQTGEQLPDYDDGPADGVDPMRLCEWLATNRPERGWSVYPVDLDTVRDVLAALQAVGDATLVKNETYRLMRRDGADVERVAAWLSNNGYAGHIVEHGGNPIDAALAGLRVAKDFAESLAQIGIIGKA